MLVSVIKFSILDLFMLTYSVSLYIYLVDDHLQMYAEHNGLCPKICKFKFCYIMTVKPRYE